MKNKKNSDKQLKSVSCEIHSNLMLMTTAGAMIVFVGLMLIYMGIKNPALVNLATGVASFGGVISWILAAVLAVYSVKKHNKYFLEYIIYLIIVGFGFNFMFNAPFSMVFMNKHKMFNWAHDLMIALIAANGIFFIVSVAWHAVLANQKRK